MKAKMQALKARLGGGVSPALASPLLDDGYTVNPAVTAQLAHFLMDAGVKGLFVGGTTGEGILLEPGERMRLHQAAVAAAAGAVPVILHVGANRLKDAAALAAHAESLGADAIAAVTPYYYGMDDDGLAGYYAAVAAAAPETPLLMYDIPHMAVNGVGPALAARLAREIPSMAGMKSSQRDANAVRALLDAVSADFIVLAGNESVALGLLALGVDGLISGLSTAIPEPYVALTAAMAAGDLAAARKHQRLINQLLALMPAGKRIGGIKRILAERGVPVGPAVPPRPMPAGAVWPPMEALLQGAGLI